jgi:hypothetical protein
MMFKVDGKVFFPVSKCPRDTIEFWNPKKPFFLGIHGMCLFEFLFIGKLGTCIQNSYLQEMWNMEKNHFPQGGMLKFTYKAGLLACEPGSVSL